MKSTGIVRKIDELGRIVIPKEIRKSFNIRNGEDVLIYVEDNLIILKKYEKISSVLDISTKLIKEFSKFTNSNIYLSDKHKIIVSSSNNYIDEKIDNKINSVMNERKDLLDYGLSFGNNVIEKSFYAVPIIIDADAIGCIIIVDKIIISEKDKLIVNLLNSMISLNMY